jgi:Mismatch repair ATPase (MutS family)
MSELDTTLLHTVGKDLTVRSRTPVKAGKGVIDDATFKSIEVDRLFDAVNASSTAIGQAMLYRSFVQPLVSSGAIKTKQEALRELDSNPYLRERIQKLVHNASKHEEDFYRLLFGTFLGFLGSPTNKRDSEGYGYEQYRKGTRFMLDLAKGARELPIPESAYLKALVDEIRRFDTTVSHELMQGPVYLTERGVKTFYEKSRFTPAIKFRPTLFKPGLITAAFVSAALLLSYAPAAIGLPPTALPILMIFLFPASLLYIPLVGSFDRNGFIYPLRDRYRDSSDVQNTLEALGKLDELLSFRRYSESFGSPTVLPRIFDSDRHSIVLRKVRNPVLGKGNAAYVPNDIRLNGTRLTFVTGPNSGGKTAFCKTIAQVQLLAQIGCYIPAEDAELSVTDGIFYQAPEISALEEEEGRFGTELRRTKHIFLATTPKSLVILDELSEGTTYKEKLEIATNILNGFYRIGNNTILITHNHELVEQFRRRKIGQYRQVEFAEDSPTYRLVEGISRVSHADRVARKIRFTKEDIENYLAERGYIGE